ncbi:hypothetical protein F2P56_010779 [Juglans regia]|uniref:Ankyrin repeat-containing protein ITN1-like n=2 Tax=Juglans regia TaxID=51240 RepID=A0A2I4F710_JUGRE|nr:ankyrin repeat-containing protein ITN1-like [Juglans regia]KAF5470255.1 hypothetical protein F2P56_010779 [Juglans regia]
MAGPEIREDDNFVRPLLKAVRGGDWNATRDFLNEHPHALTARMTIFHGRETVLHAAVDAEQEEIVMELVNMMSEHDLAMQDNFGYTALHISGNQRVAEYLIKKNKRLVSIRNNGKLLPVAVTMFDGHKKLTRYLYSQTPLEDLEAYRDLNGASLLNSCFYQGDLGIHDISLADLALAADQFRLNIQNHGQENTTGSGFKRLYEMKFERAQFQQLLTLMCQEIEKNQYEPYILMQAVFEAIKRGNFEFVYHIGKANPDLLWEVHFESMGIFHWAVLHRQHRIFSLLYSLKKMNAQLKKRDKFGNTILHMAGMVIKNTAIDSIRGAVLQMQREVQWFKEVERICPLTHKEISNKYNLTARQLFTKDHKEMRKEGENWMKGTATSCTVVGALIITIMFAAAFTIPGGNHQDTGLPILMHGKLFKLFIVTDSLSLFSSSTSVLMFLGILTSRYAEEDFLRSLPRKMIIGLFALFFSIVTMMIAFSAALLLMLRGKYRIVVPIIGLAGIPIIIFVLMQSRLLVDMFNSTYRPGIFDRKKKPWI